MSIGNNINPKIPHNRPTPFNDGDIADLRSEISSTLNDAEQKSWEQIKSEGVEEVANKAESKHAKQPIGQERVKFDSPKSDPTEPEKEPYNKKSPFHEKEPIPEKEIEDEEQCREITFTLQLRNISNESQTVNILHFAGQEQVGDKYVYTCPFVSIYNSGAYFRVLTEAGQSDFTLAQNTSRANILPLLNALNYGDWTLDDSVANNIFYCFSPLNRSIEFEISDIPPTVITQQPISLARCNGSTAVFSVTATGVNLSYQWLRNGNIMIGQTASSITVNPVVAPYNYRCVVTGNGGIVTSDIAYLTINVGTQINSQPSNVSQNIGTVASFTVIATGTNLTYQWYNNAGAILGATGSSVLITITQNDQIYCIVTGACGSVTSNTATLTARYPLTITQQPQPQVLHDSMDLSLSVTAISSYPPIGYEWNKDSAPIPGTNTNTYSKSNIKAVDAGVYYVSVDDATEDDPINSDNANVDVYHWIQKATPTTQQINKIFGVGSGVVYAVCSNSIFLKSIDGGETFAATTLPVTGDYFGVHFVNGDIGWVCGYLYNGIDADIPIILKTTNGGDTWVQQTCPTIPEEVPFPVNYKLTDVIFSDSLNGWICGQIRGRESGFNANYVLKTVDGGLTWNRVLIQRNPTQNDTMPCLPAYADLVAHFNDIVIKPNGDAMFCGFLSGHNIMFIVTIDTLGAQLMTADGGYGYVTNPTTAGGSGEVSYLGGVLRWAGNDGNMYTSNDDGITSTPTIIDALANGLSGIWFTSANTGHVCVYTSQMFRFNGVSTPSSQNFASTNVTNWIYMVSETQGYTCGSGGEIFKYQL